MYTPANPTPIITPHTVPVIVRLTHFFDLLFLALGSVLETIGVGV
jgi:hypothetical protein